MLKAGSVGELNEEQDIIGAQLMDLITPSPSAVNRNFWDTYKSDPEQAIADFYAQSKRNDYVKVKAIAQNIAYKAPTKYGDLEITINLSKPEKDPKAIAAAKNAVASDYQNANFVWKMKVILVASITQLVVITVLFVSKWKEMTGASNIHHMLTLMNILSSFMVARTNAHQSIDVWSSPINC